MTHFAETEHFPDPAGPDAETLVRRLIDLVSSAKSMPLSASVLVSKDEVVELLEEVVARLPEELRQARWMLKERDEYLAKIRREGEEILEAARLRAEAMVQRTEIVRESQHEAQRTIDAARTAASQMRLEAEDYCDQKLAQFEIVLDKLTRTVQAGRDKLRAVAPIAEAAPVSAVEDDAFFDQDNA